MPESSPFLVLDAEGLAAPQRAWLSERATVARVGPGDGEVFWSKLATADALVVRTYTQVDRALLARAPRLRVVGRAGVGLDNVDVRACRERGVEVVYTPDANGSAVSELVFAALLDLLRPRTPVREALSAAEWAACREGLVAERELGDLTLGIWGFGRVGKRVARIAAGFGMAVRYYDILSIPPDQRGEATPAELDALLGGSHVVTVHVSGEARNRGLVREATFARLRPDAIFVNASRGFVVDTADLSDWLRRNPSARAILDVHEEEPIPATSPVLRAPNALLLPHIGAATRPAKERMSWVVSDVWRVLQGEAPKDPAPWGDPAD